MHYYLVSVIHFIFIKHFLEGTTDIVVAHVQLAVILDKEHNTFSGTLTTRIARQSSKRIVEAQVEHNVFAVSSVHACLDIRVSK